MAGFLMKVFCIYNNLKSWMVLSDTQEIIELSTVKGMMRQFMDLGKVNPAIQCCHYSRRQEKHQNFSSVKMPLSDLQSGDEKRAGLVRVERSFSEEMF